MDLLRVVLPNGASWTVLRPWLKPRPAAAGDDSWKRAEPQMVTVYLRKDPYEHRADSAPAAESIKKNRKTR